MMRLTGSRRKSSARTAALLVASLTALHAGRSALADFSGTPTTLKVDGGWCWFQDPRAIIDNGHLVFGSVAGATVTGVSTGGDEDATDYNFNTQAITTTTLATAYDQDDHASPALAILPDNRLLITYESHGAANNVLWRVSTNAGDGTSWGAQQTSVVNVTNDSNGDTYNNPYYLSVDNTVYDFSRAIGYDPNYSEFTGLSATNNSALNNASNFQYGGHALYWQNPGDTALSGGNGRPYVKYASNGTDKIWIATTNDSPQNYINSLYSGYVQFNSSGGGIVYNTSGGALGGISTSSAPSGSANPPTGGNQGSIPSGTGNSYLPTQLTPIIEANTNYNGFDLSSTSKYGAGYVGWGSSMQLDSTSNPYLGIVVVRNLTGAYGNNLEYDFAHLINGAWQVSRVGYAGFALYNGQNQYAGLIAVDPLNVNKIYISDDVDPNTDAAILGPDGKQHWEIFAGVTSDNAATWNWTQLTNTSTDNIRPVVTTGSGKEALLWMQGSYTAYTSYNTNIVGLFQSLTATGAPVGIVKADTSTLANGSDWVGGIAPGANDVALIDSTVSAVHESNLTSTSNLTWSGLTITSANGPVTIQNTTPFTLTLGPGGINMSSAVQNVIIKSSLSLAGATNQTWTIAQGRTLTLSTGTFTRNTGATLNVISAGVLASSMSGLTNDGSEGTGILGSWATFGNGANTVYAALSGGNVSGYAYVTAGNYSIPTTTTSTTNYEITTGGNITFGAASRTVNTLTNAVGGSTLTFGNSNTIIQLIANGILNSGGGGLTLARGGGNASSGVQIGSARELGLNAANSPITISAPIFDNAVGASSLTVVGTDTVTLSGPNAYTGATYVTSGLLVASNSTALGTTTGGTTVGSGATLDIRAAIGNEAVAVSGAGFGGVGALIAGSGAGSLSGTVTLLTDTSIGGSGILTLSGAISDGTSDFALIKVGPGTTTLTGSNSYSGITNVSAGSLVFASANALPANANLNISAGASVLFANHGSGATYVPTVNALTNNGTLDLTNNAMVIHNGSTGSILTQLLAGYNGGTWNASGAGLITSSIAAGDTTHLTAIGFATGLTSFQTRTVLASDLLLKYTYYGDANLDGKVDGSDYSRIDNGYLQNLTGWYNGDFNYDGVVDGSDYTLIDNAFNTQSNQIPNPQAIITAQMAGSASAVPEPTSMGAIGIAIAALLGRRRKM